jgi:hypothetical protein
MDGASEPGWLVRREIALIKASAGVDEAGVELVTGEGAGIAFTIATERSVHPSKADIRPVEPILFTYESPDDIGLGPPATIVSTRPDFPRDLGHLNPVRPGLPPSLCLAAAGLRGIYERFGIEGVLERLRNFLRDAKIGALMQDGWEPVPFGQGSNVRPGVLDAAFFQELAARQPGGGVALGAAGVKKNFAGLKPQAVPLTHLKQALEELKSKDEPKREVPWVFVWPDAATPFADPVFGDWTTYGEIAAGLEILGLKQRYETALGEALVNGVKFNNVDLDSRCAVVVVVGVWRPQPLRASIFGLSSDDAARRLELRAYLVVGTAKDPPLQAHHPATVIVSHCLPGPELYRFTSGVTGSREHKLIGAGALGSAIAEDLLRSGATKLVVVDKELLDPHNLARHAGRKADVFSAKVDAIASLAEELAMGQVAVIEPRQTDITRMTSKDIVAMASAGPIIDATASEGVRRHLAHVQQTADLSVLRTEIFDRGRLGVLFQSHASGADLIDLYCCLLLAATTDASVHDWLRRNESDPAVLDHLQLGFGCASLTTKLPGFAVRQHVSAFLPSILGAYTASGIGLNPLDEAFRPTGWRWIDVPPFVTFAPKPGSDWRVRVHPGAFEVMVRERANALPNETGGYLYGGWDARARVVSIVFASELPPGSRATPGAVELGPAGTTEDERRLEHATRGRLHLLGSWHSHTGKSAALSGIDLKTLGDHATVDRLRFVPTVGIVVADGDRQVFLEV